MCHFRKRKMTPIKEKTIKEQLNKQAKREELIWQDLIKTINKHRNLLPDTKSTIFHELKKRGHKRRPG